MTYQRHIQCPSCRADLVDGQSFCSSCGALQFMTDELQTIATKVRFSQNKLRNCFISEIRKHFDPDEFIHAHTYGPNEYYVLSDRRLYIGAIRTSGFLKRSIELAGLKQIVDLHRATQITQWSELFYADRDEDYERPFMNLQIETFDGNINLTVEAFEENAPFYCDPHYFQAELEQVFHNIQTHYVTYSEALWRAETAASEPAFTFPILGSQDVSSNTSNANRRSSEVKNGGIQTIFYRTLKFIVAVPAMLFGLALGGTALLGAFTDKTFEGRVFSAGLGISALLFIVLAVWLCKAPKPSTKTVRSK